MSLRETLGEQYKNLGKVLAPYAEEIMNYDENLRIKGKTLEHANREQPSWLAYYDERRIELHTLVRFFEIEISSVKSKIFKGMENYPRDLSDRAKDKYIESNPEYLFVQEKYLMVKEMYLRYEGIVEAFRQRGFALRNITNIRVASLEDVVI